MSRSIWKGVVKKIGENKPWKANLKERNETITPDNVGKTYKIDTGLYKEKVEQKAVKITTSHIGHKFGEYAITKKPAVYKRKSKK